MAAPLSTAKKFSIAYFALAALVGGAIGTFVLLVERPAPLPPPPWSVWQPTANDKLVRAQEIGTHIAAQYHLKNGNRFVRVVVGSPDATASDPVQGVVLAKKVPAVQSDVLSGVPATDAVMYMLCGDGANCTIDEGKSSPARAAVLRREALELALYTFSYVKDIDAVTVLTPPAKDAKTHKLSHVALFFRTQDVEPALHNPLADTLPGPTPSMRNLMRSKNLPIVYSITQPLQFDFSVTQDNTNNRGYLVLDKPRSP
jgi:hypothetical protein